MIPASVAGLGLFLAPGAAGGQTTRISVDSNGAEADEGSFAPAIAAKGRFVAFSSVAAYLVPDDTNAKSDIFIHDRKTGIVARVSVDSAGAQSAADSLDPSISANGRFVAFESSAPLVADDSNGTRDVFVHNRKHKTTSRVSVGSVGAQADGISFDSSISASGRFVAFTSEATNLIPDGCSTPLQFRVAG